MGHYLCKPNDKPEYVYVITKGHAKLLWAAVPTSDTGAAFAAHDIVCVI